MAGHYFNTVENVVTGKPVANATVLVYQAGATISGDGITAGTLATIFSDDGITQINQSTDPITTNSRGFWEFWTDQNSVAYEISYGGTPRFAVSDVEIVGGTVSSDITALQNRVSAVEDVTEDATIAAVAGLTGAADKLAYFNGVDTIALADFPAFARTLVANASAADARSDLGLVIGTDVQAYDADLAAIAGLTSAADKLPYFTGSGTAAVADFTSYGRTLLAASNQSVLKPTESIIIAASDETTALTTGVAKVTFRMPYAFTLSAVRASVTTAPTGAVLTVDINEGGVSILSTKLTIDATEKTSTTAATPAVISDSSLADDAEMTIDIDTVGSTIAGAGLKIVLIGTRT